MVAVVCRVNVDNLERKVCVPSVFSPYSFPYITNIKHLRMYNKVSKPCMKMGDVSNVSSHLS